MKRNCKKEFRITGLNKKGSTGIYATCRTHDDDRDWFHSDFDQSKFSIERQYALFDYFKKGDDTIWKDNKDFKGVVVFEYLSEDGTPINPLIIDIVNLT